MAVSQLPVRWSDATGAPEPLARGNDATCAHFVSRTALGAGNPNRCAISKPARNSCTDSPGDSREGTTIRKFPNVEMSSLFRHGQSMDRAEAVEGPPLGPSTYGARTSNGELNVKKMGHCVNALVVFVGLRTASGCPDGAMLGSCRRLASRTPVANKAKSISIDATASIRFFRDNL